MKKNNMLSIKPALVACVCALFLFCGIATKNRTPLVTTSTTFPTLTAAIQNANPTIATKSDTSRMITISADTVTIFWDKSFNYFDTISSYKLFYLNRNNGTWVLLKDSIPVSENPSIVIHRNDIQSDDSIFYFAVRCVTKEKVESDLHTSEDTTAFNGGWALVWPRK
jgi:hypothetical protein